MPDDRFIHKRAGRGDRTTMLTDFEFRVWTQYLLSADDFGVMRCSPLTIQADNDVMAKRPIELIEQALAALVEVKLLHVFEQQKRAYLFQHDWQDWQKLIYPRKTNEPKPPHPCCSRNTQWLFEHHPGGKPLRSWKAPESFTCEVVAVFPEDLGKILQKFPKSLSEPLAVSRLPLAVSRLPLAVEISAEASSTPPAATDPGVLTFPTVGPVTTWTLTEGQIAKWQGFYPALDVLGVCRSALAWCDANARKRKTSRGMVQFLDRWLRTENDRPQRSASSPVVGSFKTAGNLDSLGKFARKGQP